MRYAHFMTEAETFGANISVIALVLSVLGFVVAGYSLGWQIYKHFKWARPHLVVSGTWARMHMSTNPNAFWELEVTVANIGDLDTQIENVYWEFGPRGSKEMTYRVRGSTDSGLGGMETDGMHLTYDGELDPELPVTILPFSSRRWVFKRPDLGPGHGENLRDMGRGRASVQWVSRAKIKPKMGENPHIATSYGPWQTFTIPPDEEAS